MNVRRCFADVAALGPYLYVCGGSDDQSRLNTVEKYDPFNNVWIPVPSMTTDRNGVGVAAGHGRIYAVGKYYKIQYCLFVFPHVVCPASNPFD